MLREALRYVLIGLGFGLVWAVIMYQRNDHEFKPTCRAGDRVWCAGLIMWGLRRAVIALRNR